MAVSGSATRFLTVQPFWLTTERQLRPGAQLATWDPHTRPIVTEYAGTVKFENVEKNATVAEQMDEVTGLSTLVVIDPKRGAKATKGVRPQVKLIDESGQEVKIHGTDHIVTITFQVGSLITVKDGQPVAVGDILARIPQESSKTRDITGGLPRVAELFEARVTKGCRCSGGGHGYGFFRQGHQGQAASGDH
jgi:DNA-directed RNA polymerase subunit beta'